MENTANVAEMATERKVENASKIRKIIVDEFGFQAKHVIVINGKQGKFGGLVSAQFEVKGFFYEMGVDGDDVTLTFISEEEAETGEKAQGTEEQGDTTESADIPQEAEPFWNGNDAVK